MLADHGFAVELIQVQMNESMQRLAKKGVWACKYPVRNVFHILTSDKQKLLQIDLYF